MICKCCGTRMDVIDSRPSKIYDGKLKRRYSCKKCKIRLNGIEVEESEYKTLIAIKNLMDTKITDLECLLYTMKKLKEGKQA